MINTKIRLIKFLIPKHTLRNKYDLPVMLRNLDRFFIKIYSHKKLHFVLSFNQNLLFNDYKCDDCKKVCKQYNKI